MGARTHIFEENQAYFLTSVTQRGRRLFGDPTAAQLFVDTLVQIRAELRFALLSFVVMPDHIHLLLVPGPAADLARTMQLIKGRFAREVNKRRGDRGPVWQQRYYEGVARTEEQLLAWVTYIDNNPVQARLSHTPQAYPFSSAHRRELSDLEDFLSGAWGDVVLNAGPSQAGSLAFFHLDNHGESMTGHAGRATNGGGANHV